jgi:hypothetical protein
MEVVFIRKWKGESLNIVSAFEALGKKFNNTITPEDFKGDSNACPGAGSLWRNVYSKYHVLSKLRNEFAL